jgi:diacylglycerol O-acyltransferase
MPQRSLNTVTTNVPGPQRPIYLTGRRMLEAIPYVPIAGHVRVGVAIFSYDGSLRFGVTGDYDTAPDIRVLCQGIESGMDELVVAAGTTQPVQRPADREARTSPSQPEREPGSRA